MTIGFNWVFNGVTGIQWVPTVFYWVLLGFSRFQKVQMGLVGFFRILLGFRGL